MTTSSINQYATYGERRVAGKLVRAALDAGYTISVNDGEEWTVKNGRTYHSVMDALCTTGEDTLRLRDANGDHAGSIYLVWGNADDGSELIAGYTTNDLCEGLWKQAMGEMA